MNQCDRTLLLFPPNWSNCVYGPHLALPLLAGALRKQRVSVRVWDLTQEFTNGSTTPPGRGAIVSACERNEFGVLDQLYFDWEDQFVSLSGNLAEPKESGLLSGYSFSPLKSLPLQEAALLMKNSSPYSSFYRDTVLPRLHAESPVIVGLTIASQEQLLPAIELLMLIKEELPDIFVILGGNIITRLRDTTAFGFVSSLADQVVLYQGDLAIAHAIEVVREFGVETARKKLPRIATSEQIPYAAWGVPSFDGIELDRYVGVPAIPYVSTRGCYYGKCHFCAIPAGWSKTGYAGSAPADFVVNQLEQMYAETGIRHIKFVDEAVAPKKADEIASRLIRSNCGIEWEGYARLEPMWEDLGFLERAYAGGLRKLYFGLEQAPTASRVLFGKNDRGNPISILKKCEQAGIRVHLFCMVGHPGTTQEDARATLQFLLDHQNLVDTADLVGFRLDRGTTVPGVRPLAPSSDWAMALPYEPMAPNGLTMEAVNEFEAQCQEVIWDEVPRLLHPLYRTVGPWSCVANPALALEATNV